MAVDYEMVRQRKLFISDVASAFSDPQKGVRQLEKQEQQMSMVYRKSQTATSISWDIPDQTNVKERLSKFQK